MFGRKPRKPNFLWVYGPKAGGVNSARSLSEIRSSADARARRTRGPHLLARQSRAQGTVKSLGEFRQIRVEVRAEKAKRVEVRRARQRVQRVVLASLTTLGIAGMVALGTTPAPALSAPSVSGNWGGVEMLSRTPVTAVSASMTLPDASVSPINAKSPESAFWVGFGGDQQVLPAEGGWLPQAGWYIWPTQSRRWWLVTPWAYTASSADGWLHGRCVGWSSRSSYVIPAGTTLDARVTDHNGRVTVTLWAKVPKSITYLPVIRRTLPTLVGEPHSFALAEAILETPNRTLASAKTQTMSRHTFLLPGFGGPIPMGATFQAQGADTTLVPVDLRGAGRVTPSIREIAAGTQPDTIHVATDLATSPVRLGR